MLRRRKPSPWPTTKLSSDSYARWYDMCKCVKYDEHTESDYYEHGPFLFFYKKNIYIYFLVYQKSDDAMTVCGDPPKIQTCIK